MNKDRVKNITIDKDMTIASALKQMDAVSARLLLILEKGIFVNLLSIGDLQRAIINNYSLDTPIEEIMRKNVEVSKQWEDQNKIKDHMLKTKTECMPILDEHGRLVDVIFWEDLFPKDRFRAESLCLPVVIMAGGKGTRMKPLTNIIPKPLIPIDDKTLVEHIIDNFLKVGCSHFFLSVNHLSTMIRDFFQSRKTNSYTVSLLEEVNFLGTAGSLHLLDGKIESTFFISNCDILIEEDYAEIYKYHKEYKNELTIVAAFRYYSLPYGMLTAGKCGELKVFQEKPQLNFLVNSGMYIIEPHLIKEVPKDRLFDMTDLIRSIQKRRGKIGVFPVNENAWKDIGEWDNYLKLIKR